MNIACDETGKPYRWARPKFQTENPNMKTLNQTPVAPAQAQHSPLPWNRDLARLGMIRDEQDSIVSEDLHTYDAAFIVRACNNVQRLADALRWAIRRMDRLDDAGSGEHSDAYNNAVETIAEWSKQK